VHADPADVVAADLPLAGVQSGAHMDAERLHRVADRSLRAVEHGQEPIARRVHLAAVLLATGLFGYVGVREPLGMRVGYANDDLVRNILRFVGEERLVLCVTRPDAVLKLTNLPAPATTRTAPAKK
jgi:hypothetical protein